eukprot:Nk52_evm27s262 gene=Nk52_evmTU27s262
MSISSIAAASHNFCFGIKADVQGGASYLDEQTVIYPAGANTILYNIQLKTQKFIPGTEGCQGTTACCLSPNRRYAAIAEKGASPTITIYDLNTLRKRKTLSNTIIKSEAFISMAFSQDSKYLITQGGAPDWTLLYWTWEKSKAMAHCCSAVNMEKGVHNVAFNPHDSTQLSVIGDGVFRLYRYAEGNLNCVLGETSEKLPEETNAEAKDDTDTMIAEGEETNEAGSSTISHVYTSQVWLSEHRLLLGTKESQILLYEDGVLKWNNENTYKFPPAGVDEPALTKPMSVHCVVQFSKGFICAGELGTVCIYEAVSMDSYYEKVKEFAMENPCGDITTLALSPSEEMLLCITEENQAYVLNLANLENLKGSDSPFQLLSQSFHYGAITGLDTCFRKPLVASCSVDQTVRIWNYKTESLELVKYFSEEAYSIALHPSGLHVLVGFSDKLRLMNILIDDIRPFREFSIRACRECRFSNGGHLIAAVHGNVIQIFNAYTFDNIGNLKGHNGKVKSVCWTQDDTKLISCGADGAVYEWNIRTFKREGENVTKSCSYTSTVVGPDGSTLYGVGSDKSIKEINDSQIIRENTAGDCVYTQVAVSRSGRMLFVGTSEGSIRALKFPLSIPGDWQEHQAHSKPVARMVISHDDQFLFTASEDCSVYVFKIADKEGRGLKRDKDNVWSDEVLITKSDLDEKKMMMTELTTRVEELKMENEYQLRLKDMSYNEKIKELTEKYIQEMESLKIQNTVLKADKDKEEAQHEEEITDIRNAQAKQMHQKDAEHNQKLMAEYERYQKLQVKGSSMQANYETQLRAMEESKEQALDELTEYYEAKIIEKVNDLDLANDEQKQLHKEHEETKMQLEEDIDREIADLKGKYEMKLKEEKDAGLRLKGENGIMRKKFNTLQKEIEEHKNEITKMFNEEKKLNSIIKSLEKEISSLKKEIQERDETIQEKEKRIYDLKKKNQELEKFKFVLDYKIKELKKQIEPRENEIKDMKDQIQDMDHELEKFHKKNTNLDHAIGDLQNKLRENEQRIRVQRQHVQDSLNRAHRLRGDLHGAVRFIQDPEKLKAQITQMYKLHIKEHQVQEAGLDQNIKNEYNRQKEYLVYTINELKERALLDIKAGKATNMEILQQNVGLIQEINTLRKTLKNFRHREKTLEMTIAATARTMKHQHDENATSFTGIKRRESRVKMPTNLLRFGKGSQTIRKSIEDDSSDIASFLEQPTKDHNSSTSSIHMHLLPGMTDKGKEEEILVEKMIKIQQEEIRKLRHRIQELKSAPVIPGVESISAEVNANAEAEEVC